ncbi:FAD-dependent oxidoreductase [Enterococcus dongliensis]|uniref:FAD-dependent oxidoreductase n=1 Tax=Enterococcus dongliensis TaxID=2559925 RepID=UPI00289145E0|nr:FAD-dependent oxidoreductase [Enterococcus dongliensis]MDT2672746.1 FAD-dependent oxidoreductase [Enterococcus dongliensis]
MLRTLFDEIPLSSGASFKNRLFMSPMTTQSAFYDGEITQQIIDYYAFRSGDAAAVIVESCFIEDKGRGFPGALGVDTDKKITGLSELAKAIKVKGSKAIMQIYHAGRMAWPEINGGVTPISASPIAALRPNAPVPREMTEKQILEMITMFGDATRRAIKAGFDGVEIHGANTFLLQQFFSPHSNRREDQWGGSREKRAKFPLEVMREVQRVVKEQNAENFIIGYRFSPEELEEPGIHFEDTMYLLNALAELQPDYFHFSMGAYTRPSIVDSSDSEPLITKYLAQRSPILAQIPIMGVGSILQRTDAEEALKLGYDLLAIGKGFLIEPNWVNLIKENKEVIDYAHVNAQRKLLIPTPLWDFMAYMVIDPEEEKRKHERLKELQKVKLTFKPGTYTIDAKGHNSELKMNVTFSEDRIEKIEADQSNESEGLSDQVFIRLPQQIIEGQTLNVDVISGASTSSQGLIDGVAEAVELAGASSEVLRARPKPSVQWSQEIIEESADVVIVGSGAAGIAAALRANQMGLKTILVEKLSFVGGAISISGGNQVVMGSKLQAEAGVIDDTVECMMEDFLANGSGLNVPELLQTLAENIGETTDWVHEYMGVEYDMKNGLHTLAEYRKKRELAYKDGGHGFAASARKALEKSDVTIYLQTKAESLLTNGEGKVIGLTAVEDTGKRHNIHASAVILTTGGYGNNPNLLSQKLNNILFYGTKSSTGDGILMATTPELNAATRLMEYGKIYPNGVEVSQGYAKSTIGGNLAVLKRNGLLVNSSGNRVINERASNKEILEVLLQQTPQMLYLLMDAEHFEIFTEAVEEGGITREDLTRWIDNENEAPQVFRGATLQELAEKAGMPYESLVDTVARYNGWVEKQKDEDFDRQLEFLQERIGEGPYYLIEQKPRFATTMGGLVANHKLQVLNRDNRVIDGLYAAGELVGGVMGSDSPSGANNAWALTSGKLAAESVQKIIQVEYVMQ